MTAVMPPILANYHNLITIAVESGIDASNYIKAFNELSKIKQFMDELKFGVSKFGKYKIDINRQLLTNASISDSVEINLSIIHNKMYRVTPGAFEDLLNKADLTDSQANEIWEKIDNFTDLEKERSGQIYRKFSIQRDIYHEFTHGFYEKPGLRGFLQGNTGHLHIIKHVNKFMHEHYGEQYRGDYGDTMHVEPYHAMLATRC